MLIVGNIFTASNRKDKSLDVAGDNNIKCFERCHKKGHIFFSHKLLLFSCALLGEL